MFNSPVQKTLAEHISIINGIQFAYQNESINIYVCTLDGRSIFTSVHFLIIVNDKGKKVNREYSMRDITGNPILYDDSDNSLTIFNKSSDAKAYELSSDGSRHCQSPVHILVDKFKFKIKPDTSYEILIDYVW